MHAHGRASTRNDHPTRRPARDETPPAASRDSTRRRAGWVFLGFLAISAFFLAVEHRAHLYGLLPWLVLLACPLMHVFMHRGHGHGGHRHGSRDSDGREE